MSTSLFSSGYTNDPAAHAVKRYVHSNYHPANEAPFNRLLHCQARDGIGTYKLPMLCMRTEAGWINARTRTRLHVQIIGWRAA